MRFTGQLDLSRANKSLETFSRTFKKDGSYPYCFPRRKLSSKPHVDSKIRKDDHNYCVNLVKERDREGFLCGLLMPSRSQRAYFAIRAFNVESASIKDGHNLRHASKEPREVATTVALQMRMQWWRDALGQVYGEERSENNSFMNLSTSAWNSPVVRELDVATEEFDLTRRFLERLIDARELDLEINQYKTLDDYIEYSEESVSSLLYLSLECNGVRDDEADEVAYKAGIGIGLTTALRSTPFRLMYNEVPIPEGLLRPGFPYYELLRAEDDKYTLSESDANLWNEAVERMYATATANFIEAGNNQRKVPRKAKTSLLPMVPAQHYLLKLQQAHFNLFDQTLNDQTRLPLLLKLARSWATGVY